MIVLCYGMTKSGSTLAFELCKALLEASGFPQRRLSDAVVEGELHAGNFLLRPSPEKLQRALDELAAGERIAIKLHARLDARTRDWLAGHARFRVQLSYRDPRDIALSLIDAGATVRRFDPSFQRGFARLHSLDDAVAQVRVQMEVCRVWAGLPDALPLGYEDTAFDPEIVITRMATQLDLAIPDAGTVTAIREAAWTAAAPQRNKAVPARHRQELTSEQDAAVLTAIAGAAEFIERACVQRDARWLTEVWARSADRD